MYGDSKAITSNKQREKKLNVTKQPCHARGLQRVPLLLSQTRQKCRWRTNVKKTNICIVKAIASGTVVSSTNQERHYKQQR